MQTRRNGLRYYMCTSSECKRRLTPTKRPSIHIRQDNWWNSVHAGCRFKMCSCTICSKRTNRNFVLKPK